MFQILQYNRVQPLTHTYSQLIPENSPPPCSSKQTLCSKTVELSQYKVFPASTCDNHRKHNYTQPHTTGEGKTQIQRSPERQPQYEHCLAPW